MFILNRFLSYRRPGRRCVVVLKEGAIKSAFQMPIHALAQEGIADCLIENMTQELE